MVSRLTRSRILEALGFLLEPIVLVLLKTGVTWNEFSEVAKAKFVDVATKRFGIRGRPTNVSRVAILTGLDRREVRKLRLALERPLQPRSMCKPTQLLDGWFHDAEFLDEAGRPRDLEVDGEYGSFESLVRRYAPGIPRVAMIKELRAVGAIESLEDGRLRVLKRSYIPLELSEDRIALWGSVLHDVGATWEHNLLRDASERSRFERRAVNLNIDRKALPDFQAFLESEGQAFLERVDDWLAARQVAQDESSAGRRIRLGVGVYHIGEDRNTARRAQ